MNPILQDILTSMRSAVENITLDAQHKGFKGDVNDAPAVLDFLANYSMDSEDYGLLYANSSVLEEGDRLIQKFGDNNERKEAAKLVAFDYNA